MDVQLRPEVYFKITRAIFAVWKTSVTARNRRHITHRACCSTVQALLILLFICCWRWYSSCLCFVCAAYMPGQFDHFRYEDVSLPSIRSESTESRRESSRKSISCSVNKLNVSAVCKEPCLKLENAMKVQKKRKSRGYAAPSVYAHLPQTVPDSIRPGLTLLIVGLNPGVMTAKTSLHFANPTNLFWPLLFSSGIVTRPMKAAEGCRCIVDEFDVGITNIIERPTAEGGELAKSEYAQGAAILEEKIRHFRPRAMSCSGKGIWEAVFRHIHGRPLRKGDNFQFGWQTESWAYCDDGYRCPIFVTMGTSGRVAAYTIEYKRSVFAQLGRWVQNERPLESPLIHQAYPHPAKKTDSEFAKEEAFENISY